MRDKKSLPRRISELKSAKELVAFVSILDGGKHENMAKIAAVFGADLLPFLELFAGATFRVPTSLRITRASFQALLWSKYDAMREDEEALQKLSEEFDIPPERIARLCEAVDEVLMLKRAQRKEIADDA